MALEASGEALEAALPASDDSSMDSWTSDDFTAAGDTLEAAQEAFGEIDPPLVAEEFHALLLEQFGMLSQMFDTMATAGVFGALMYVEQLEDLDTEVTTAAQAIEDTCGIEFTDTLGSESVLADTESATPVVVANTGTIEPDGSASHTGTGSRENPVPFGQTVQIHPDWEMTVVSVTPDATDLILAENSFNEPPVDGQQFFLATVRLTYIGDTSDEFYVSDLNAVGQSAVSYNQYDDYCGTIPDELPSRELFTGGTIEGNVCWSIESEDVNSLVLYDNYGEKEDRVFLSMVPEADAIATPVAASAQR